MNNLAFSDKKPTQFQQDESQFRASASRASFNLGKKVAMRKIGKVVSNLVQKKMSIALIQIQRESESVQLAHLKSLNDVALIDSLIFESPKKSESVCSSQQSSCSKQFGSFVVQRLTKSKVLKKSKTQLSLTSDNFKRGYVMLSNFTFMKAKETKVFFMNCLSVVSEARARICQSIQALQRIICLSNLQKGLQQMKLLLRFKKTQARLWVQQLEKGKITLAGLAFNVIKKEFASKRLLLQGLTTFLQRMSRIKDYKEYRAKKFSFNLLVKNYQKTKRFEMPLQIIKDIVARKVRFTKIRVFQIIEQIYRIRQYIYLYFYQNQHNILFRIADNRTLAFNALKNYTKAEAPRYTAQTFDPLLSSTSRLEANNKRNFLSQLFKYNRQQHKIQCLLAMQQALIACTLRIYLRRLHEGRFFNSLNLISKKVSKFNQLHYQKSLVQAFQSKETFSTAPTSLPSCKIYQRTFELRSIKHFRFKFSNTWELVQAHQVPISLQQFHKCVQQQQEERIIQRQKILQRYIEVEKLVEVPTYIDRVVEVEKEVQKLVEVERVKLVEVPKIVEVERFVQVQKNVDRIVYVDKIVQVQVPVRVQVQKNVDRIVYVDKIVQVQVQVPVRVQVQKSVDRIVYVDKIVQVQVPVRVQVEKIVEVQRIVDKIVQIQVPVRVQVQKNVDRIVYVDKIVQVQVPVKVEVEKIVEVQVPVEVQTIVEKLVEVPSYVDRIVEVPTFVEKIVEVERLVEKVIEVPKIVEVQKLVQVEKIVTTEVEVEKVVERVVQVQKLVEVPTIVERIVNVQKLVEVPTFVDREVEKIVEVQRLVQRVVEVQKLVRMPPTIIEVERVPRLVPILQRSKAEARPILEVMPIEVRPITEVRPIIEVRPMVELRPSTEVRPMVHVRPIVEARPVYLADMSQCTRSTGNQSLISVQQQSRQHYYQSRQPCQPCHLHHCHFQSGTESQYSFQQLQNQVPQPVKNQILELKDYRMSMSSHQQQLNIRQTTKWGSLASASFGEENVGPYEMEVSLRLSECQSVQPGKLLGIRKSAKEEEYPGDRTRESWLSRRGLSEGNYNLPK